MSKIDDGGPAFPESYVGCDSPHEGVGNGMTLRQWYAGQALVGLSASQADPVTLAEACRKRADALIAELKKEKP